MYLEHFQLTAPPFALSPDPRYFFKGAKYGKLLSVLSDRLQQNSLCLLQGPRGVGKTTVIGQLRQRLGRSSKVIRLMNPEMSAEQVANHLLRELGSSDQAITLRLARLYLKRWLAETADPAHRITIIVENADTLPGESVQLLQDLVRSPAAGDNGCSVLLSGSLNLQSRLEALGECQAAPCYTLQALNDKEVHEYLNFRASRVGHYPGTALFTQDVSQRIAELGQGIPRNIHLLADKALSAAFQAQASVPGLEHLATTDIADTDIAETAAPARADHQHWWLVALCLVVSALLYFIESDLRPESVASAEPAAAPTASAITAPSSPPEVSPAPASSNADSLTAGTSEQRKRDIPPGSEPVAELKPAPEPEPIPQPIQQPAPDVPASALARSQQNLVHWLAHAPADAATIQLLLVRGGNHSRVNQYLEALGEQLDPEQLMVYSSVRADGAYYGVLYQQFANRMEAYRHKAQLPAALQRLGPFITRTAKGIKDEQGQF